MGTSRSELQGARCKVQCVKTRSLAKFLKSPRMGLALSKDLVLYVNTNPPLSPPWSCLVQPSFLRLEKKRNT